MEAFEFRTKVKPNGTLSLPSNIMERLKLQPDSFVRLLIFKEEPKAENTSKNPLLAIDDWAVDMGIEDLSEQHDHYLYGIPKK